MFKTVICKQSAMLSGYTDQASLNTMKVLLTWAQFGEVMKPWQIKITIKMCRKERVFNENLHDDFKDKLIKVSFNTET